VRVVFVQPVVLTLGRQACDSFAIRAEVTRLQNTTLRRVDARFYGKRSCTNLQELLRLKKIKWLMQVCFAVRMRLVAVDGDVMNRKWNDDAQKTKT
jgi:hypothetical protein